jgi:hypothetical protein
MKVSPHAAASAAIPPKLEHPSDLNPAKQAKAAQPEVKGAEFGHLVASFAHARHAPPPPSLTPPITDPPPVEDIPPSEATEQSEDVAVVEDTGVPADSVELPPEPTVGGDDLETQLLADLIESSQPGDKLDMTA